jgi:hypothetical protein
MKTHIVPYVRTDKGWSLDDDTMRFLWHKMGQQGLIGIVFNDGRIANAEQFLKMAQNKNTLLHTTWNDENKPLLVAWLTDFGKNYAFGHFVFFKETWGRITREIGHQTIEYWWGFKENGNHIFDVILGYIPNTNKMAINFIKNMGFTIVGEIPKIWFDAYNNKYQNLTITYIERER